jgi:hypothetical protein
MNNEFIPYRQAISLQELNFNEPCMMVYYQPDNDREQLIYYLEFETIGGYYIKAPLYQQAFRWFREKYCICSWVYQVDKNRYFFSQLKNGRFLVTKSSEYNTYEEAELECLNKLIELVKNK